jgi:hypothetical protein
VIGPVRIKPSRSFIKSLAKLGEPLGSRTRKALARFQTAPRSPGLNFEAVKNRKRYFTIRVNRNFRIVLRQEEDENGPYFLLIEVAPHDDAY